MGLLLLLLLLRDYEEPLTRWPRLSPADMEQPSLSRWTHIKVSGWVRLPGLGLEEVSGVHVDNDVGRSSPRPSMLCWTEGPLEEEAWPVTVPL